MLLPALADAADLATLLDVDATDPKLLLALKRASGRFRGSVKRPISLVTDDAVVIDGSGSDTLLLPSAPVVGTPTVVVAGVAWVAAVDFSVSTENGVLKAATCWPADVLGNVQVTYTHGFDPVPDDVADAVLEQAELQYQILVGIAQLSLGAQSFAFGTQATVGVTQRWSDAVTRYRMYRGDRS